MKQAIVTLTLNFHDGVVDLTTEDILEAINEFDTNIDEIKSFKWVKP